MDGTAPALALTSVQLPTRNWPLNRTACSIRLLKLLLHATLVPTPACSLGSSCLQLLAEITPACSLGSRVYAPGRQRKKNVGKPKKTQQQHTLPEESNPAHLPQTAQDRPTKLRMFPDYRIPAALFNKGKVGRLPPN